MIWNPWMFPPMEKPTATQYKVYQIIENLDLTTAQTDNRLKIHINDTDIATQEQVLALWVAHEDWIYTQSDLMHYFNSANDEIAGGYLLSEWGNFLARNGQNLLRAYNALNLEYNPLYNYDLHEEYADLRKKDKETKTDTPSGKIINETSITGTETTTQDIVKYGLNSTTGQNSDKITTTNTPNQRTTTTETSYENAKTETETEYGNTKSETFDNETHAGYHETEKHLLKKEGNVGVTSPVQMLTGELEIRKTDLIRDFVHRFFCEYCYFVG